MRSSGILLACAALALTGARCSREVDLHPFRVTLVDDAGASLVPAAGDAGQLLVVGQAARVDATELSIRALGRPAVTVQWDRGSGFLPPLGVLDGRAVTVDVRFNPAATGPEGEPLPVRSLRIFEGGRARLLAAEGTYRNADGIPFLPLDADAIGDAPSLEVVGSGLYFEPNDCGDVYYDRLAVGGTSSGDLVLDPGERAVVSVPFGEDLPPWKIQHVMSLHRGGPPKGGRCAGKAPTWTQAAAWR